MLKWIAAAAPIIAGAYYFLADSGYSRTVERTPGQVVSGLADLDITKQPGAPGSTPVAGVTPKFVRERTADGFAWRVMSGNTVAVTMYAHLKPVDDGRSTQVTASVQRGNAPDESISPVFRSTSLTMSLFASALDDELNDLTAKMTGSRATCEELYARLERANYEMGDAREHGDLGRSIGDVAKTAVRLKQFEAESRRLGCDNFSERFDEPPAAMQGGAPDPANYEASASEHRAENFSE